MEKERVAQFAESVYRDMAGAMSIGMGYLGQRTGLFGRGRPCDFSQTGRSNRAAMPIC
jgi:hypothetical protein